MEKEKICGIYCIENLVNGKKYIGFSENIQYRFYQHKINLNNERHINEHLQAAWNLYKEHSFIFYVIESCLPHELAEREIYYISKFKTRDRLFGYNMTDGGDAVKNLDKSCADKISVAETLYPVIRLSLEGKFICEYRNCRFAAEDVGGNTENIRVCCDKKYGRKTMYNSIWMYKFDYEQNGCNIDDYKPKWFKKSVLQYDLDGNFIAEYESAREAERITGIGFKMISRVCNGDRPYTHGFIFKFKTIQND
jgi:group I intron endonuclease